MKIWIAFLQMMNQPQTACKSGNFLATKTFQFILINFSPTPIEVIRDHSMSHQVVENDSLEENEVEIDIDSKTVFDTIDLDFEISPKNRGSSENSGENDTMESSGDY